MPLPSLLCIHGSANGAWVWDAWRRHLKPLGWQVNVVDLRGHGLSHPIDFTTVTMDDYVNDVASVTPQIAAATGSHPVMVGWSMGGLVALMYAAAHPEMPGLILFAPSPPMEVAGRAPGDEVRKTPTTAFGPELYGIYPDDIERSRPALFDLTDEEAASVVQRSAGALESGFARRQRQRGIAVAAETVTCPVLVVYGEQDRAVSPDHSRGVASYLHADTLALPEAGHWGILYHDESVAAAAPRVDAWLRRSLS